MMVNITELNDDCLLMVLNKIPLNSALEQRLVCSRFKHLIELRCQRLTSLKVFSFKGSLHEFGVTLKRLNFQEETNVSSTANDLQLLRNFPPNISNITPSQLSSLPPLFRNTINLFLDCSFGRLDLSLLKHWHLHLTTLTVGHFSQESMAKRDEKLWGYLASMTSLTSLTCIGDDSPVVSAHMATVLGRLKVFIVNVCPIDWLFYLGPRLERLHILRAQRVHEWKRLLESSALPNRHHMTCLQIDGYQENFYMGDDILHFIKQIVNNFPSVTHLDLSFFMRDKVRHNFSFILTLKLSFCFP